MARYDKLRKSQRNERLVQYRQEHPELALAEIGEMFNISWQRVQQILKRYGNGSATDGR